MAIHSLRDRMSRVRHGCLYDAVKRAPEVYSRGTQYAMNRNHMTFACPRRNTGRGIGPRGRTAAVFWQLHPNAIFYLGLIPRRASPA